MMRRVLVLGILLLATAGVLHAQTRPPGELPDGDPSRFSFHRAEHGFVRLDLRSGEVSFCTRGKNGWECLATADERAAYQAEIDRLLTENAALKKTLLDNGLSLPKGAGTASAPPLAQKPAPDAKTPSDAEIDRVISVIERIWRRLVEMMVNLQRDLHKT